MSVRRTVWARLGAGLALAAGLMVSGCATNSASDPTDPFEQTNRDIFQFNMALDRNVAKPVAQAYVAAVPEPARDGVHNFIVNLGAPVVFVNNLLQGDVDYAAQTFSRFSLNSTLGVGGLIDVASRIGVPPHDTDFGITLGRWGVDMGPFLMLPLMGPSTPRAVGGKVADIFFDPLTYISWRDKFYYSMGLGLITVVDLRAQNLGQLETIERTSVDFYATTRNLYLQYRKAQVNRGQPDVENLPNF